MVFLYATIYVIKLNIEIWNKNISIAYNKYMYILYQWYINNDLLCNNHMQYAINSK